MSTEKAATTSSLLGELFQLGLYKPTQGRIARQITGGAFALTFLVGAWRFYATTTATPGFRFGVPLVCTGTSGAFGLVIALLIIRSLRIF